MNVVQYTSTSGSIDFTVFRAEDTTTLPTTTTTASTTSERVEDMVMEVDGQIAGQQLPVEVDFSEYVATVLPFQVISMDELTSTSTTTTTTTTPTTTTTITTTTTTTTTTHA